jgi:hypothetical protein
MRQRLEAYKVPKRDKCRPKIGENEGMSDAQSVCKKNLQEA